MATLTKKRQAAAALARLKKQQQLQQQHRRLQPIVPDFQSRRSLYEHVHDNMVSAGRQTYFQRLIYIYRLKADHLISEDQYVEFIGRYNQIGHNSMLTGLFLNYKKHSVHMIEGSENVIGRFVRTFLDTFREFIEATKLVLVYCNANQRFFNRSIIKIAEPLQLVEQIVGTNEEMIRFYITQFITRVYDLCGKIQNDEMEDHKSVRSRFLTGLYIKILPEVEILDFLLTIDTIFTLEQFDEMFYRLPDTSNYADYVWPVPIEYLPTKVFDWNKYDVNLTFGYKKF